jgi:putative membrane protein
MPMPRFVFAAAAAAAMTLLPGCTATDAGSGPASASAPADATPEDRGAYVAMAGASDLYEIQSSQLALSKAQRPEVRQFAQMLVTHHTQTTQQVTAAATAAGLRPPPPQLMPMHAQMIAALEAASGASFDSAYLSQQIPAHEQALALHSNYAQNGDAPALRTAAAAAVPIVQSHLDQARRLNSQ